MRSVGTRCGDTLSAESNDAGLAAIAVEQMIHPSFLEAGTVVTVPVAKITRPARFRRGPLLLVL
jgi:hypothetical protein